LTLPPSTGLPSRSTATISSTVRQARCEAPDQAGKRWKVGDTYTGSAEQIQAAKNAGQVQDAPADPNAPE